ncbi:hypothetical protein C8R43DRAFT_1009642 [Mycena crocata]|nr:hypothetical protein C8R43DRAFT_1009642 [Mycena crocata]
MPVQVVVQFIQNRNLFVSLSRVSATVLQCQERRSRSPTKTYSQVKINRSDEEGSKSIQVLLAHSSSHPLSWYLFEAFLHPPASEWRQDHVYLLCKLHKSRQLPFRRAPVHRARRMVSINSIYRPIQHSTIQCKLFHTYVQFSYQLLCCAADNKNRRLIFFCMHRLAGAGF